MKQRQILLWFWLKIFLLILASALRTIPAAAQAVTILAVAPAQVSLPLGNQFVLELTVSDGEDINGFDLRLTYNQGQLSLLSWAHGGYLKSLSCVNEIKSPGLLELECSQIGQSAVSGDGTLLELTFDTLALGSSDMALVEAVFVDDQGLQSQPDRANGVVNVQDLPTWTPTFTVTSTIAPTQTLTVTPTPSQVPPTATAIAATNTPTPSLTPSLTSQPGQGTPVPDGTQTPEGTPTQTLTTPISGVAGPSQRTLTLTATLMTATAKPTDTAEPQGTATLDEEGEADAQSPRMGLWARLLLGFGVLLLVALVVLILLRIRRRKQQNEDLLL